MDKNIAFLALGLGNGAVYAALGLALVMTFRSSGTVNFGTGATALYAAYTYAFLRKGQLLIPLPGLSGNVSLGRPLDVVPAIIIALVIAAAFGALLYGLVFRPLRNSSLIARAVASIGVMLVLQAVLAQRIGTNPISVSPIFSADTISIGGSRIPTDRLILAGIVVAIAALLSLGYRFTRFGLATRAAAESEKGALVIGLSPDRIAFGNWALSTAVAGASGILIAPIVPLVPIAYTLFIVPAMAAAFVGNLGSMFITVLAGLVIGALQSDATHLETTVSWFPKSGVAEAIPLLLILVFLLLRGRPLPSRGTVVQPSLGRSPRPRRLLSTSAVGLIAGVILVVATTGNYRSAIIVSFIVAIIALSQVVVTGFAGQVSLAQLTLAGVSAFTLSRLTENLGVPFPIAPLLSALAAAIVGVVVGLPALRVRGLPLMVVTLSLAVFLEAFWFTNNSLNGGITGAPVRAPRLFGVDLGIGAGQDYPRIQFGILCLVVLVLVGLGVARLRVSRYGAAMLAVRANERSAAAAGVDVALTKLAAFAIGAFIAGLGGALLAYQQSIATAPTYTVFAGIGLFTMVYVAGVTSVSGGVLAGALGAGGIVFMLMDRLLHLGDFYATISGVLLIVTIIKYPEGIVGQVHRTIERRRAPALHAVERLGDDSFANGIAPAAARRSVGRKRLLETTGLAVRYGGVVAVDDVSIAVHEGEIVGIIGPNGAGKTTLIDAISGFVQAEGEVLLHRTPIHRLKPHRRSRRGLGRTFQGVELYDDMTVRENIEVGLGAARGGKRSTGKDLHSLLGLLGLQEASDRPVSMLSQGQRQLVSVARVLAGSPAVALLDEPAAGLDTNESRWLGERLRTVRDYGVTIVMIDHDMDLVLEVCDRIIVLDLGRVIAQGTPEAIRHDPEVIRAYLGTPHTTAVGLS
ncbi:MAG: transporter [Nocardia sp.]|uniref:branched-chain amino acid ABC transporter permease/ATP-binding protein n=1 Tax=Nocardia sp. TaxID=1821 RepID=UPI0026161232|nr:branched-chain amino acid ABC transporter permease/ATP-binding protein [Nocardia sp.]MCU1642926.1 transporter [Nocardia sp.]